MILITGGTGVIGRSLVEAMSSYELLVVTRATRLPASKSITSVNGDVSDSSFLEDLFKRYRIDGVIHLAWTGVTGADRDKPEQLKNLIAYQHLVDLAIKHSCTTFIGVGSQAEYGIYNRLISETDLPRPETLYGLYKLTSGLYGKIQAQKAGMRYAWLRLFGAYGPHDHSEFLIPYTISRFIRNESPALSSCDQFWDYLYAADAAQIIGRIFEHKEYFNDIFNLSSGEPVQLKAIVEMVKDLTGSNVPPGYGKKATNGTLHYLVGDNSKLKQTFGLPELTSLGKGLSLTVDWHKEAAAKL